MLGLDAQFNLISYAVLSTKFESNKSITLSFMPLVEHLLLDIHENVIKITEVVDSFESVFGYKLPYAIINELLGILAKNKKIVRLKDEYIEICKSKLVDYDLKDTYELRLRALISDIGLYVKKKDKECNKSDIVNSILRFIIRNVIEFNSFISYKSDFETTIDSNIEIQSELIEFFIEERRNNTENYKFLQDIYYGVVLASLITTVEAKKGTEVEDYSNVYNIQNVLLDSNFIFRLLDLQTELEHKVAMDTYSMLKKHGCSFWVCKETLKQIADALRGFYSQYSETANKVLQVYGEDKFAGIAAACLRKRLTPAKIEIIIANIPKKLEELSIKNFDEFDIEEVDINIDEKAALYKIKPEASPQGIFHDLLLIEIVRRKRPNAIYQMRQAKWWVLTDDNRLTKWNCDFYARNRVQECITEAQIATIMWLNEPKMVEIDNLFPTILALRNRDLADNSEYAKISKIIEEQKDKYIDDEKSIDKLALVFSKQMLRISDFLEDADKVDELFEEKMDEAEKQLQQMELLKKKNDELEIDKIKEQKEHELKITKMQQENANVKSILSKEIIEHIELLQNMHKNTMQKVEQTNSKEIEIKIKKDKQIKTCRYFVAGLFGLIMYLVCKCIVPCYEGWYNKNELLYEVVYIVISVTCSMLGFNIKDVVEPMTLKVNKLLIKIHWQKDYDKEIQFYEKDKHRLQEEAKNILSQIDEKMELK